ncbi:E3 ubiquitin-protein ligase MIB2 isoform X2 [Octopus sinensis]|uniref:E3 ubiquitin-protein ligase MIB2 isoform X2 n=1 Tax=Octopus sinensis TaxID=2607531 RepID=A0A6P7TJ11_9MOLL|nr:E3 ubiquitin-protein ligase MIB2 isoform X2 [Octopus sinensis]
MAMDGNTELHWACRRGQSDKVAELLELGLAVNAMAMDGNTPLHWACREGYYDMVNVLLAYGADVNLVANDGYTPLHWACRGGFSHIVDVLLTCKLDVNVLTRENYTALHWACRSGNCDTITALMKSKPEINTVALDGNTPLHLAVSRNDQKMVELLLSQDQIQLNIQDHDDRQTPLHNAVSNGHVGLIHALVLKGADVNAGDMYGDTSLHLALKKRRFKSETKHIEALDKCCLKLGFAKEARLSAAVVVSYLAEQGADLYCRNKYNTKPIDLIEDQDLKRKIKVLYPPRLESPLCSGNQSPLCSGNQGSEPQVTDSQKLDERDILSIAKQLSNKWRQVGIFLGIKSIQLDNIRCDYPLNTQEQSFQMLNRWYQSSRPEQRTVDVLKKALKEAECFEAIHYLPTKRS